MAATREDSYSNGPGFQGQLLVKATVVIANGQSASDGLDTGGMVVVGLVMPAAWTAADIAWQASLDGTNWSGVLKTAAGTSIRTAVVASGWYTYPVPVANQIHAKYIRLLSTTGGSDTPLNQGADRTITLLLKNVLA
jgi:hypothetical protein